MTMLHHKRWVVLDTETTGISPDRGDRIIELGCVEIVNRRVTGNVFHSYVYTDVKVHDEAFRVHGISNEFLADKPPFEKILNPFLSFIEDSVLIIHNAPFDIGFLNAHIKDMDVPFKRFEDQYEVMDTLPLARSMHPGQRNSLDALCKRYRIDASHREFHGALLDAHLLARVYLAMTGGQESLFGSSGETESQEVESFDHVDTKQYIQDGVVVYATEEESQAHDEMMASLH